MQDVLVTARRTSSALALAVALSVSASAGPYSEAGIHGYIDPITWGHVSPDAAGAIVNPIFRGWAISVVEYAPSDDEWIGPGVWNDPTRALGPATGHNFDIVSLGDLDPDEIDSGKPPGYITLTFGDPSLSDDPSAIRNHQGYDFAVFENAFLSLHTIGTGSVAGQMLAELAYVEVSSNGEDFARFPSVSLTTAAPGPYGTIEVSDVLQLAGKHPNAGGVCTGTPFDLDHLATHSKVLSGAVDLNDIRYVRIVDVPGSGHYPDEATGQIDPQTGPHWQFYGHDHAVYDAWPTWGSGGFDLEAVGVLHEQQYSADINLDGVVDWSDFALLASAWRSRFGQDNWIARCDMPGARDLFVDGLDLVVFAGQWRAIERWRAAWNN